MPSPSVRHVVECVRNLLSDAADKRLASSAVVERGDSVRIPGIAGSSQCRPAEERDLGGFGLDSRVGSTRCPAGVRLPGRGYATSLKPTAAK
jgi:hypothetical protein